MNIIYNIIIFLLLDIEKERKIGRTQQVSVRNIIRNINYIIITSPYIITLYYIILYLTILPYNIILLYYTLYYYYLIFHSIFSLFSRIEFRRVITLVGTTLNKRSKGILDGMENGLFIRENFVSKHDRSNRSIIDENSRRKQVNFHMVGLLLSLCRADLRPH